ncbi:hypothetical protein Tco_0355226 [Tanacetum coccineum]
MNPHHQKAAPVTEDTRSQEMKRRNLVDEDDLAAKPRPARTWIRSHRESATSKQKKYVKDLVEIHNIKQRDGETIEDFMERFKVETGRMKGAPKCMRIFGFMHGVNNPELTKSLNEHVPKTMKELMTVTTAFIRGEVMAASKKKDHLPWKSQN